MAETETGLVARAYLNGRFAAANELKEGIEAETLFHMTLPISKGDSSFDQAALPRRGKLLNENFQ